MSPIKKHPSDIFILSALMYLTADILLLCLEYEESPRALTTRFYNTSRRRAMFDHWNGTKWLEVADLARLPETIQSKHPMHL